VGTIQAVPAVLIFRTLLQAKEVAGRKCLCYFKQSLHPGSKYLLAGVLSQTCLGFHPLSPDRKREMTSSGKS